MMIIEDQLQRKIELQNVPQRIISLVPSITLTLFDLGAGDLVAGRTKFCIHPREMVSRIAVIGGTKKIHLDKIDAIQPGLIIANKEENEKEQIEELTSKYPVYISDVVDLDTNYQLISDIGSMTGHSNDANAVNAEIRSEFSTLEAGSGTDVAYFIWRDPYMVAGKNTFINNMIESNGWRNVFNKFQGRYPEINAGELGSANPELILLSSEPYPFTAKHIEEFLSICPKAKIITVNGEYFSWYGSRMRESPAYFNGLLHSPNPNS